LRNIFKNAKPTHSSCIRDNELKNQRKIRTEKFLEEEIGFMKLRQQKLIQIGKHL